MKKIVSTLCVTMLLSACGGERGGVDAVAVDAPTATSGANLQFIFNARIHTVDLAQPLATAMAFDGNGQILAVGSDAEILAAFPDANGRDLAGAVVIPGLIDSHGHLLGLAVSLSQAQLTGTSSKAEVLQRLRAHVQKLGPEDWLLGRGWDQNDWPVQEFPTREDLDVHFPDRPVWLSRIDGHAGWANSRALALVDRDLSGSWQPEGGFIHRDSSGQPTGILIDGAETLVSSLVPPMSEALLLASLDLAVQEMLRTGLTGVHDPGIDRVAAERYMRLSETGQLPVRVYGMTNGAGSTLDWLCERGAIEHPSGRFFMRATKLYEDGAMGSRGAALLADYSDDPGNRGLLFHEPESLAQQVNKVMRCGFQAAIHAIGDRGNRVTLDALEAGIARYPDNPGRHRIEHAQLLTAEDLGRFASANVIAAMQPTHATSDMYWVESRVGPERIRYGYIWRSLLDSGARLAFGSDFPVEEVNPMLGLSAAVTRQDQQGQPPGGWYADERVSRAEALRGFTLDAAWAGFMEHMVGSLEAGKRADFVIIDRDILQVPAADIAATRVLETWVDGQLAWSVDSGGE